MANTLTVDQISATVRAIVKQATGRTDLAALDLDQLLTIGQSALETAPDTMLQAMSQVWSRTIFSSRKYVAKFARLRRDSMAWGNAVRKIALADKDSEVMNEESITLRDGNSVDQYKVDNVVPVQLNFYGQQAFKVVKTLYMTQFNTCFHSAEEFARFQALIMEYIDNKIESVHEATARGQIAATIAGVCVESTALHGTDRVVHLVTEYKTLIGKPELKLADLYKPEYFDDFARWVIARIKKTNRWMTERTVKFQTKLTGKEIVRHTPAANQISYFQADFFEQMETRVLDTLIKEFQELPGFEEVSYWQSVAKPDEINVTHAKYLDANGAIQDIGATNIKNVFGITMDQEACGYSPIIQAVLTSPLNANGMYRNMFWHFFERHWTDYTEKIVVYLLD